MSSLVDQALRHQKEKEREQETVKKVVQELLALSWPTLRSVRRKLKEQNKPKQMKLIKQVMRLKDKKQQKENGNGR